MLFQPKLADALVQLVMGFNLRRWILAALSRRELGVTQADWKYLRFSYAQFAEDLLVEALLPKPQGFYIDVGAYHPVQISNTYLFYRKGWHGLVIDANPDTITLFRQRRPRDLAVEAAISEQEGEALFNVYRAGPNNRLRLPGHQAGDHIPEEKPERVLRVQTRTLKSILEKHLPAGQVIDFMSVDCEGADLGVLKSNDWTRFLARVLVVEDWQPLEHSEICSYLKARGYTFWAAAGVSRIFRLQSEM